MTTGFRQFVSYGFIPLPLQLIPPFHISFSHWFLKQQEVHESQALSLWVGSLLYLRWQRESISAGKVVIHTVCSLITCICLRMQFPFCCVWLSHVLQCLSMMRNYETLTTLSVIVTNKPDIFFSPNKNQVKYKRTTWFIQRSKWRMLCLSEKYIWNGFDVL